MSEKILVGGALLAGFMIYKNSQKITEEPVIEEKNEVIEVKNLDQDLRDKLYWHITKSDKQSDTGFVIFTIGTVTITVAVSVVLLIQNLRNYAIIATNGGYNPLSAQNLKKEINDIPGDSNLDKLKKYASDKLDNISEKAKNLKESAKQKVGSSFYNIIGLGKTGGITGGKIHFPEEKSDPFEKDPVQPSSIETSTLSKTEQEQILKDEINDLPQDTLNQSEIQVSSNLPKTNEYPKKETTTGEVDKKVIIFTPEHTEIKAFMKELLRYFTNLYEGFEIANVKDLSEQDDKDKNKIILNIIKSLIEKISANIKSNENITIAELEDILSKLSDLYNNYNEFILSDKFVILIKNEVSDREASLNFIKFVISELEENIRTLKIKYQSKYQSSCNIF